MTQRTIRESVNHFMDSLPDNWDKAAFAFDDEDELEHKLRREVVNAEFAEDGKAWRRFYAFKRGDRRPRIANFDLFTLFPIHERTSA